MKYYSLLIPILLSAGSWEELAKNCEFLSGHYKYAYEKQVTMPKNVALAEKQCRKFALEINSAYADLRNGNVNKKISEQIDNIAILGCLDAHMETPQRQKREVCGNVGEHLVRAIQLLPTSISTKNQLPPSISPKITIPQELPFERPILRINGTVFEKISKLERNNTMISITHKNGSIDLDNKTFDLSLALFLGNDKQEELFAQWRANKFPLLLFGN